LLADRIVVCDDGSRRQLLDWGVEPQEIELAESALMPNAPSPTIHTPRRFLLLGTTPPRPDRPDAVTYHLTERTYRQMLESAFAAVAEFADALLVVRLHPRSGPDSVLTAVRQRYAAVRVRMSSRREKLGDLVAAADCVLSCASSAGIEAAAIGRPVVQLLPEGSGDILPAAWYGLRGSARNIEELRALLSDVFDTCVSNDRRSDAEAAHA
jgi:hypothetical protein